MNGVDHEDVLLDTSFHDKWKTGYKFFLILTSEVTAVQKMFEDLVISLPADLMLQTVVSLMQDAQNINIKQSKDIDREETRKMAKHIFSFLEKKKQLKIRDIYKALSINSENLLDEYKDIFAMENTSDFEDCVIESGNCKAVLENFSKLKEIQSIEDFSSHPVHIQQSNGEMNPTAFIPFCRIGNTMQGVKIENFSQPVCNAFYPKTFEGQKCYSININKLDPPLQFDGGVDSGLELLIDLNEEKSIGTTKKNKKGKAKINSKWNCPILMETI